MTTPVPGLQIEQQPSRWVRTACLWAEARGEPALGRLAVLYVIHNRAKVHGIDPKQVVLAHQQFSSFNPDDPNRPLLLLAHLKDPINWTRADEDVDLYDQGGTVDPTHGALNYYVTAMPNPPAWAKPENGWKLHAVIGKQSYGVAA
jgi:hypothetical protein